MKELTIVDTDSKSGNLLPQIPSGIFYEEHKNINFLEIENDIKIHPAIRPHHKRTRSLPIQPLNDVVIHA